MANQSPQNRPNGNNNNDNRNGDRRRFSILTILIIAVAVTLLFNSLLSNVFSAGEKQVTYDAFLSAVETDAISQVEIQSDRIQFLRRDEMALSKSQRTVYYTGLLPNVDLTSLISTLEDNQVEFSGEIVENSTFTFLFSWVLFPLLMLAVVFNILCEGTVYGNSIARKPWHDTIGIGIGALSNLGLCAAFVPRFGMTGAAFALAASNGLAFLYRSVTGQMYYRTIPSFAKTISGFLLAFAVTAAGTLLWQHFVLKFVLTGAVLFIYCTLYRAQLLKLWNMGLGILRGLLKK